jgi:hypothetical protein
VLVQRAKKTAEDDTSTCRLVRSVLHSTQNLAWPKVHRHVDSISTTPATPD